MNIQSGGVTQTNIQTLFSMGEAVVPPSSLLTLLHFLEMPTFSTRMMKRRIQTVPAFDKLCLRPYRIDQQKGMTKVSVVTRTSLSVHIS
jgi:hypothetical protein